MAELVLFSVRAEAQLVHALDHVAQVVAGLDLVLDLAKDLANLVLQRLRAAGLGLEAVQVREQLAVDEGDQVVAGHRLVVVGLAVLVLRRSPAFPLVLLFQQESVRPAFQVGHHRLVALQRVQVFEEQQPGGLLGVVQFAGAAGILVQDVVDVLEGLFEHAMTRLMCWQAL